MATTEPVAASRWPWQRDWWVVPLLLIEVAGGIGANHAHSALHLTLAAVLGGAAALALLTWRRWPIGGLLVNAVLVCAYFGTGQDNGPILFTPLIATFLAARSRPPRTVMPWVGVAIALGILGLSLRSALWNGPSGAADLGRFDWSGAQAVGQSIVTIAVLLAAAAFGNNVRTRDEARSERARRAASDEQLRMAQDLHDGVGHGLAVIAMQAGVALHVLEREPERARESLEAIRDTSRESLEALRAEIGRLAPMTGPAAARGPRNGIQDLPALVDRVRAGGLTVTLESGVGEVPEPVGGTVYLVVQEALTNVLRHSTGTTARVQLADDGGAVVVSVADDGQVPPHETARWRSHSRGGPGEDGPVTEGMGLRGMRDRVEALGGTLLVGPGPDGFTVWARIPLGAAR